MTSTTNPQPRIFKDGETVGPLDTFEVAHVAIENLKPGMIALDPELHTPYLAIDHRIKAPRNSGSVAWFCENLEGSGYMDLVCRKGILIPVAAR